METARMLEEEDFWGAGDLQAGQSRVGIIGIRFADRTPPRLLLLLKLLINRLAIMWRHQRTIVNLFHQRGEMLEARQEDRRIWK